MRSHIKAVIGGDNVNIELTNSQFRNLLDLAYLGEWMVNANREGDDRIEKYSKLLEYIFSKCGEFGYGDLSQTEDGEVFPTEKFEKAGVMDFIDDYGEDTLASTLAEYLATRDAPSNLEGEKRMDNIEESFDNYMKEFDENGFENVSVDISKKDTRTVKL